MNSNFYNKNNSKNQKISQTKNSSNPVAKTKLPTTEVAAKTTYSKISTFNSISNNLSGTARYLLTDKVAMKKTTKIIYYFKKC